MPSKNCGEELRKTIKSIRDGTFEYENREPKKTNWIKYDYAQIKEMSYYLENLRDLVEEADKRIQEKTLPKKRGQVDHQSIHLILQKYCYYKHTLHHQIGWLKDYCCCSVRN